MLFNDGCRPASVVVFWQLLFLYFVYRLYKFLGFIFIFISSPRLHFFSKSPVKQKIKKLWPHPVHAAWWYDITIFISFRVRIPSLTCRAYSGVTARPLPSPCSMAVWHHYIYIFQGADSQFDVSSLSRSDSASSTQSMQHGGMTSLYLYLSGCRPAVWRLEPIPQWQRILYPVHAAWWYDITMFISFRVRIPSLTCRAYPGVTARPLPSPCSLAIWHHYIYIFQGADSEFDVSSLSRSDSASSTQSMQHGGMTSLYLYLSGCGFRVWRVEPIPEWQRVLYPVHAAWWYDITIFISFRVRIPSLTCRAYPGVTARPLPSPCSMVVWHHYIYIFQGADSQFDVSSLSRSDSASSTQSMQLGNMTSLYLCLTGCGFRVWRVEPIPEWQRVLYPVHAAWQYDITIFMPYRVRIPSLTCRAYPGVTARPLPSPCSLAIWHHYIYALQGADSQFDVSSLSRSDSASSTQSMQHGGMTSLYLYLLGCGFPVWCVEPISQWQRVLYPVHAARWYDITIFYVL